MEMQCLLLNEAALGAEVFALILHMKKHGSSLIMNWGEDNNLWEVAFISGGKRYTGYAENLLYALKEANNKAIDDAKKQSGDRT